MTCGEIRAHRRVRKHRKTSPLRRGVAALTTGLLLGLLVVGSARAGEYVMRNCDVPGHAHASIGPWTVPKTVYPVTVEDACPTGGGVRFVLDEGSMSAGSGLTIAMPKPDGPRSQITLLGAKFWFDARLDGPGVLEVMAFDQQSGGGRPFISTGPPGSDGMTAELPLSGATDWVHFGIGCRSPTDGGPRQPCAPSTAVPVVLRGVEVTLTEDAPPLVLQPVGALLEGGPQSGVRTLSYSASDAQSGLARVDALLGGTVVASTDLTPRCPYSDFTVCPASQDETLQIDTRVVPNGVYRLTLRVRDAAGNERVVNVADAIQVFNAPVTGSSAASAFILAAGFKGSSRTRLTIPYGRRVSILGSLLQGAEPSPAGTQIEVFKKLDRRGAREVLAGHVVTGSTGSFSLRLPTTRPSRTVRLVYRPTSGGEVVSRALKLRVHSASRVSASLRGRVVRFSGKVLSGPMPKGGKRVQMEGRSPGSAWTPFKSFRTDKKGRFSGTYRLRVRRPGVVLKIRAVVPSEVGYGYVSSRSRAVALRVR